MSSTVHTYCIMYFIIKEHLHPREFNSYKSRCRYGAVCSSIIMRRTLV